MISKGLSMEEIDEQDLRGTVLIEWRSVLGPNGDRGGGERRSGRRNVVDGGKDWSGERRADGCVHGRKRRRRHGTHNRNGSKLATHHRRSEEREVSSHNVNARTTVSAYPVEPLSSLVLRELCM